MEGVNTWWDTLSLFVLYVLAGFGGVYISRLWIHWVGRRRGFLTSAVDDPAVVVAGTLLCTSALWAHDMLRHRSLQYVYVD